MTWEYEVTSIDGVLPAAVAHSKRASMLADMGTDGWELVAVLPVGKRRDGAKEFYFKRRATEKPVVEDDLLRATPVH